MKRVLTIAWLLLLASVPVWLTDLYVLHVLIMTGIFMIAAMSLNLLLGYTGQLSLGHVAFFGIGAYTSSLVSLGFSVHLLPNWEVTLDPKPVWLGMLCGTVLAGLCGWAIGRLSFKVRGAYFVIVTVSFAEVIRLVALNWVELTQGPMALNNIPYLWLGSPDLYEISFLRKPANYYLVLTVAIVCYVVIRRLVSSRAGRAMIALRENEALAGSIGVDVTRYLVLATVVSAAMAGAAGTLYAHYVRIVDPDVFLFIYTVTMVIMVVTGGKGTLAGPVVGGFIFGLLPETLRTLEIGPEIQWVIYGVLMILVVYFLPQGIVPALRGWWHARQTAPAPAAPRQARRGGPVTKHLTEHQSSAELVVDGLTIRFGGLTAIEGMSFKVFKGEVLSLIGPNGAGKTSAFNAITGYIVPDAGTIAYRGVRLNGLKPNQIAERGVVRTFQKTSVFMGQTVLDNVLLGLHLASRQTPLSIVLGLPSVAREERVLADEAQRVLSFVDLDARAAQLASALPYGELRLLEVAIALAAKPKLLLLDEPVSGMNPAETASFMKTLGRIRALGITILLVEHDMKMVMGVSDRVICLNHGCIIASGSPTEIQRDPEVIRAYLGRDTSVLKVEGLTCRYGKVAAVRELSMEVGQGELVALIGANGAGKTTTLKAISGVLLPAAGRITFLDKDITRASPKRIIELGIAHCPEGRRVFPYMTVLENLEMGAFLRTDRTQISADMERLFERFPILHERRHQAAGTLSGGEQQMLAISRALMSRPKLVLFDEPSLGLAPNLVERTFDIIQGIRTQGVTVVMVEQNAFAALELSDRAYVLDQGHVTMSGPGMKLLHDPHVKAAYLGG